MSDLKPKPFYVSRWLVWEAYQKVAANKGAAGVDGQSIAEFEQDLKGNLFKLWNRLSSGSLFPASGARGGNPEEGRRNPHARGSHGG